jgi:hypothetical protein
MNMDTNKAGFEFTALMILGTDCIGGCKSNYHTITATTTPYLFKTDKEH